MNGKYSPVIRLMNELCRVLTEVEANGMQIDVQALDKLEAETVEEINTLDRSVREKAQEVWGSEPINLNSPEQLSSLIYSIKVRDKRAWAEAFGIGEGKRRKKMAKDQYRAIIATMLYRPTYTAARKCKKCDGVGSFQQIKTDGTPYKNRTQCKACNATGTQHVPKKPKHAAGFRMQIPTDPYEASANGFSTSKEKLEELARHATGHAQEFLTQMVRLNALNSYRSTFIDGIRRSIRRDGIIHPSYMQCITQTGRLSSRDPNFQNQPRGNTFPIRRCIISRWEGGKITKADYSQLEFRVAAALSGCPVALQDILDGADVHNNSSSIMTEAGQPTTRQEGKPHTFKPLYGGMSGTPAEVAYYKWFLEHYSGIKDWHEMLINEAISTKEIVIPSGRAYAFPFARRNFYGGVTGATRMKNYPVQGFATADIVPISTIRLQHMIWDRGLKSLIVNQVHDENIVDTHPDELDIIPQLMYDAMAPVAEFVLDYFDYEFTVPIDVEVSQGVNWLDTEEYVLNDS